MRHASNVWESNAFAKLLGRTERRAGGRRKRRVRDESSTGVEMFGGTSFALQDR